MHDGRDAKLPGLMMRQLFPDMVLPRRWLEELVPSLSTLLFLNGLGGSNPVLKVLQCRACGLQTDLPSCIFIVDTRRGV